MSKRKLDPVEQIQRIIQDAAIMSYDLPFDREETGKIMDELFVITTRISDLATRRRQKLLEAQGIKSVSFDKPPVVEILSVTDHTVVIKCPYCGQKHIHGNIPGHVSAHCLEKDEGNCGYIIPGGS